MWCYFQTHEGWEEVAGAANAGLQRTNRTWWIPSLTKGLPLWTRWQLWVPFSSVLAQLSGQAPPSPHSQAEAPGEGPSTILCVVWGDRHKKQSFLWRVARMVGVKNTSALRRGWGGWLCPDWQEKCEMGQNEPSSNFPQLFSEKHKWRRRSENHVTMEFWIGYKEKYWHGEEPRKPVVSKIQLDLVLDTLGSWLCF